MLNNTQLACIELLTTSTKSHKDIAKKLKISEQSICRWIKSDDFIDELKIHRAFYLQNLRCKLFEELENIAKNSVKKLQNILTNTKNDNLKIKTILFLIEKFQVFEKGQGEYDFSNEKLLSWAKNIGNEILQNALIIILSILKKELINNDELFNRIYNKFPITYKKLITDKFKNLDDIKGITWNENEFFNG